MSECKSNLAESKMNVIEELQMETARFPLSYICYQHAFTLSSLPFSEKSVFVPTAAFISPQLNVSIYACTALNVTVYFHIPKLLHFKHFSSLFGKS